MSTEEKRKGCSRCHVNLPETHFNQKRNGDLNSMCIKCLDTLKRWRDKRRDERLSETSSEDSSIEITGVSHVSSTNSLQEKKCTRCRKILSVTNFKRKTDGKIYGNCISCCSYGKKHMNEKYRCAHNTHKQYCKQCNDPIKVTIMNMMMSAKQKDKLYVYPFCVINLF